MFRHLYVHVPYCVSKCPYCDFFSVDTGLLRAEYPVLLRDELALTAEQVGPARNVETIFIGGGTPTSLADEQLGLLLGAIRDAASPAEGCEWTCEANPESLSTGKLAVLTSGGVNRVSLGVQSFHDDELAFLGRAHDVSGAEWAVAVLQRAELMSWSLDLIFGFAGQTLDSWRRTLDRALSFEPPHLSGYALMIDPGSAFSCDSGQTWTADDEVVADMFGLLLERLRDAGYRHYETSNFALPGHECRHNMAYWHRRPYLGVGPSAHSFDGSRRWWNVRDVGAWAEAIGRGDLPLDGEESLDEDDVLREQVMLGMRLAEGLEWEALPVSSADDLRGAAKPLVERGFVSLDSQRVRLTDEGWLVADSVIARLIAALE